MHLLSDPVFVALAILGIVLTGISKSGFAGGAGVIAVPLMALAISPSVAVVLMLPLLLIMDAQTINYHRQRISFGELRLLVPSALLGVLIGSFFLGELNDAWLQLMVGLISIAFALLQFWPRRPSAESNKKRPLFGYAMGFIAGTSSSLIHAGGPPLNLYLASQRLPKALWISTAAVFFASINLSKVFSYAWVGLWQFDLLLLSLVFTPAALFGVYLGHRIQQRINERSFVRIVMFALMLSGIGLLVKGAGHF